MIAVAYIDLGVDEAQNPGITGLFTYRSDTGRLLAGLAEALLREHNTLGAGERELIAAYVSARNNCTFCTNSHAAFASAQLDGGRSLTDAVLRDPATAPISEKLRALLVIAGAVQQSGREVTADMIAAAREKGATDREIHDTVLIAAAFCMYNRYVDGLGTTAPAEPAAYVGRAESIIDNGYLPAAARADAEH
ncbi:carboxymuconolactone decarboxylase family protein [Nocardia arthritidis]|uniref:carboxymuconolactone decarboxylase family protein n=1 Tax=Nocardia arthritidis TaxID=228602 RepID=UPI001EEBA9B6|nr:peroxidase-related enzyme [Nocardia arthritidis]